MSVVFDFNVSLNDAAPASPILLSVDLMRMEKEWIVDGCHLCVCFLCSPLRLKFVSQCRWSVYLAHQTVPWLRGQVTMAAPKERKKCAEEP